MANQQYVREPEKEILQMTKKEAKTIIIARYGMLECGKNFKGTAQTICEMCNVLDDESHRLNNCIKWKERNLFDSDEKVNFNDVYSNDIRIVRNIIPLIQSLWNVKNAHGTMYTE